MIRIFTEEWRPPCTEGISFWPLLIVGFASPALAAEFYVAQSASDKKCTVVETKPDGKTAMMIGTGSYKSEQAAKAAMKALAECKS
jgi:hypothetical protein